MSRNSLKRYLENIFPPEINQAIIRDVVGKEKKAITFTDEEIFTLKFPTFSFFDITLGTENITLNADITDLVPGENVMLKITQGAVAKTVTWGTNIKSNVTVTASNNAVDILIGVFDGENLILIAFYLNIT